MKIAGRSVKGRPKTPVEECRRVGVYGVKGSTSTNSLMIRDTGQRVCLTHTVSTVQGNSGIRPWFLCPSCDRRVGILYRKQNAGPFLCRHCHGLSYWLRQLHRSKIEMLVRTIKHDNSEIRVLKGVGRKGFSKFERAQVQRITARRARLSCRGGC